MRSARSASRVVVEALEDVEEAWRCGGWEWEWWVAPWWPSFMAVVERAEREVVPELGVPLDLGERGKWGGLVVWGARESGVKRRERDTYGPMSEGVTGSEGGGGRLINVEVAMAWPCLEFRRGVESESAAWGASD